MISSHPLIYQIAETSLRASVAILALLLLRPLLRRWVGSQWLCVLWLLVLGRLLFPFSIESPWSAGSFFRIPEHVTVGDPVEGGNHELGVGINQMQVRFTESSSALRITPVEPVSSEVHSISRLLGVLWAVGAFLGLFGFTIRLIQTRRLASRSFAATDPALLTIFKTIEPRLRRRTELRMTDAVNVPTLAGVWRPQIWIPLAWLDQLSPAEMRHVLLHELGHARRRDMLVQRLFLVAQCLHWFNPLIWLAGHLAKADREMACDAWVLAHLGDGKSAEYGSTLLRIVSLLRRSYRVSPVLIEMATSKEELTTRVYAINGFRHVAAWQGALVACLVSVGFALVTTSAQTPASDPKVSERPTISTELPKILPPAKPSDNPDTTSSSTDPAKQKDLRVEFVVTRLEAPLPAWEILKDQEIGREILKFDEGRNSNTQQQTSSSGIVAVLDEAGRKDSNLAISKIQALVSTRTKKVATVPGRASTVSFLPWEGREQSLSIKPQLGEDGTVIDLELVLGDANRKTTNHVSIRSGHTLLLRSHANEPAGADAKPDNETIGQVFFVGAKLVKKPEVQAPPVPLVEIASLLFEVPVSALEDAEMKAWIAPAVSAANEVPPKIMTKAQVRKFLELVKRRGDIEMLSAPRVTTRTKQRAVIEVIREVRDPATWMPDPEKPGSWNVATFETTNVGVTLVVEPEVKGNDSVTMAVEPLVVEALGFVDLETGKPVDGHSPSPKTSFVDRISHWKEFPGYHFLRGHRTDMIFSKRSLKKDVTLGAQQSVLLVLNETADTKPFEAEAPKGRVIVIVTPKVVYNNR